MPDTELDHLIKMINQIADNIATGQNTHDDAATAQQVADHIKRFWARSMKQQIITYAADDGAKLTNVAQAATRYLQ